jgi:hypothetical protein
VEIWYHGLSAFLFQEKLLKLRQWGTGFPHFGHSFRGTLPYSDPKIRDEVKEILDRVLAAGAAARDIAFIPSGDVGQSSVS